MGTIPTTITFETVSAAFKEYTNEELHPARAHNLQYLLTWLSMYVSKTAVLEESSFAQAARYYKEERPARALSRFEIQELASLVLRTIRSHLDDVLRVTEEDTRTTRMLMAYWAILLAPSENSACN